MSMVVPLSVFISYARSDGQEVATRLLTELMRRQIRAWLDGRNLDPYHDFTAEIEDAIERASHIAVCITQGSKRDDSFVRREIQYAISEHKPIVPLRFANVSPHIQIITIPFIDLYRDWEGGLTELLNRLSRPPEGEEFATRAFDPLREHLERLQHFILDELRRTVLDAEDVLQLRASGMGEARPRTLPVAYRSRRPSWFQAEDQREREFASFPEAFEHHGRRVALLGEPGGGKTTTLLAFAREAVTRRLADPGALLPVYVPIRTWDGKGDLVAWMAAAADLEPETLRMAVVAERALLLLDGLDELRQVSLRADASEDPRLAFLRATTELGRTPMVVTCRQVEYEQMAASPAAKIELEGVVRLLPLTDDQIDRYLGQHPLLLETLRSDDTLRGMARNPLILTLLAMAYRDEGSGAGLLVDPAHSQADVRSRIFSKFIAQRYEFEVARLDEGIMPPFTLEEVYDALGAGAIELLDKFQRVAVEIGENSTRFTQTEGGPVDLVEMDVRSFRRRLGSDARPLLALAERLNVVVPARRGSVRFTHLLMRDHFAFAEASRRLGESDAAGRRSAVGVLGLIGDHRALSQLCQALEDPDETVRALAVWALGELGDPAAVEPLLAALQGIESPVLVSLMRDLALAALGKLGDHAVDALSRILKGEAEAVLGTAAVPIGREEQAAAARALASIGAAGVPALIDALDNSSLSDEVVPALAATQDPRALEPLISALDSSWSRWETIQALGSLGDPRAIPTLLALKEGFDAGPALGAVASIGGPEARHSLLAAMGDRRPERRLAAAQALGRLGGPEATARLGAALDDRDLQVRVAATQALGRLGGPEATARLEAALDDRDFQVRVSAATSLESLDFDPAILRVKRPSTAELLARLADDNPAIRVQAAESLGAWGGPQAGDALAAAMVDKDGWVANTAQTALARLGDARAVAPLGERLYRFDEFGFGAVEEEVAEALGGIPDPEAARLLIDALDDEDDWGRPAVASALVAIGDVAISPLIEVLGEPDLRSRLGVGSILTNIGAPAVSPLLRLIRAEDPGIDDATEILGAIGAPAVPDLLDALSDPSPVVRALTADALGATQDDRAAEPLVSLLGDADEDVRATAAAVLAELGEPAIAPLVEALGSGDPTTRAEAAATLGEAGVGEALQPLLEALNDPEPLVRRNAIAALPLLREPGIEPRMWPVIDDGHLGVRLAALAALKRMVEDGLLAGRQPSIDELLTALEDPDPQLRADVLPWLGSIAVDDPSATAVIRERLTQTLADPDVGVQISAGLTLSGMGVVDPLLDGLQAQDEQTRMACATALVSADETVSERLRQLLQHDQPSTRCWAANLLGARHDAEAIPGLLALLLDKDVDVQEEATNALVAMPEHSGEELSALLGNDRLGPPAAEAIRRMGEVAVQPMIDLLATKDERIRAQALETLVMIGRPAVKPLIETLNPSSGEEKSLRMRAAEALGRIEHRRALAALVATLKDQDIDVRVAAIRALGAIANQPAVAALKKLRRQQNRKIKEALQQALTEADEADGSGARGGAVD
jgi:HEAT repeat protein